MKILLDLSGHCIETEAKRIYEESIREYFRAPDSMRSELEKKIEGLRNFLEYSDFNHLRSLHPSLAGADGGRAALHLDGSNSFRIETGGSFYKTQKKTAV
ncbi:MAG: hypothetical protein QG578_1976 [Thermodesulfobacteriota bacterium]|nr:hypothetical protein [Thermodesulfobacteriota bacterium]